MLSTRRRKNKLRAQMPKKKPRMKHNRKRRKRSDKLSKNHHPHPKVNLVRKKRRKRSGKRNQRKLNLLLLKLKQILKKRKRKMSQLQQLKRQVDCKNHPALLANSVHLHKAILTTLETSEKNFKVVNLQLNPLNRMLKHSHRNSPQQITHRQVNSLSHLNSSKSPMT